jgi:hypothetical protein
MQKAKDIIGEFDPEKFKGLTELANTLQTALPKNIN